MNVVWLQQGGTLVFCSGWWMSRFGVKPLTWLDTVPRGSLANGQLLNKFNTFQAKDPSANRDTEKGPPTNVSLHIKGTYNYRELTGKYLSGIHI